MRSRSLVILLGALLPGCDLSDLTIPGGEAHEVHEAREHHEAHEHEEHEREEHEHEHAHAPRPYVSREAAERVLILESKSIDRATEALGIVDAHEQNGHHEEALRELREAAAALEADAILGVEFHHGEAHGEPIHLSGMAVRFRDLRRDEPYDVLGQLDVAADMHAQESAIHELQRRARVLGADLIIDIGYEHGDAGSAKTHLRGTAIRYRPLHGRAAGMP